jgi:hypothetical protein
MPGGTTSPSARAGARHAALARILEPAAQALGLAAY